MGGARTKMDENSEYASGEYASRHSLSPQSSVLFSQEIIMSYKKHQFLAAIPDQPAAVVMITTMRARTFAGFRFMWGGAMSQPKIVAAAPGCVQVKACIIGPRELLMVSYWQDMESLLAFHRSKEHVAWMRYLTANPEALNLAAEIYSPQRPGKYLHEPQGMALAYPPIKPALVEKSG